MTTPSHRLLHLRWVAACSWLTTLSKIETYFLHSPDPVTPLEETVEAMQEVYAAGGYKHVSHLRDITQMLFPFSLLTLYNKFGLSNFTSDDVRKIYNFAKSRGYVLPTVYQGNYNPVARHYDTTLFPLLRELHIAFYAYSPLAGGFLVKDPDMFRSGGGQGRWDPNGRVGAIYRHQYDKHKLVEALSEWESIANDAGMSKAALAYRWVMYNSMLDPELGDGIIIGASRPQQLEQTLRDIECGQLEASFAERIDTVWDLVKEQAPIDNYHSYAIVAGLVSQQG